MRFRNRWKLYELINNQPSLTIYEIHRKLNRKIKRVRRDIRKLMKDGLVNMDEGKGIVPVSYQQLINWEKVNKDEC